MDIEVKQQAYRDAVELAMATFEGMTPNVCNDGVCESMANYIECLYKKLCDLGADSVSESDS